MTIQNIGKILSKSVKEKMFVGRRVSAEPKRSRGKDVLAFLEAEEEERRQGVSYRERTDKENIDTRLIKDLSKEEKYKSLIKSILISKDKDNIPKHKKREFTLNVGDRKMEVKYEGSKREGKRHGKGILFYTNGLSYEGEFKAGLRSGYGYSSINSGCCVSTTSRSTMGTGKVTQCRARDALRIARSSVARRRTYLRCCNAGSPFLGSSKATGFTAQELSSWPEGRSTWVCSATAFLVTKALFTEPLGRWSLVYGRVPILSLSTDEYLHLSFSTLIIIIIDRSPMFILNKSSSQKGSR